MSSQFVAEANCEKSDLGWTSFEIDPGQAADLIVAVGLVWATAWIFVQIRRAIK